MKNLFKRSDGFTLVEILIVVIILAIMAGVIIPQFSSSTDEARLSTLKTDLAAMRSSVELYYHQHNSTYPGAVTSGAGAKEQWFIDQMLLYTDIDGVTANVKDDTYKYGPYLKREIPVNPFDDDNVVKIDSAEDDITKADADQSGGWIFYTITGSFLANDSDTAHGAL